jgi:threonine dehydrogenase-like Zn-dependent dehydrogenase
MNRSLTTTSGQAHAQRYLRPLLERIEAGDMDPSFVVSHHLTLDGRRGRPRWFKHKQDKCTKILLTPWH